MYFSSILSVIYSCTLFILPLPSPTKILPHFPISPFMLPPSCYSPLQTLPSSTCMLTQTHAHTHVHTHTNAHANAHTCKFTHMLTHMCMLTHTLTHTYARILTYARSYTYTHTHTPWSLFTFLISIVTPSQILTSEDLNIRTTDEKKTFDIFLFGFPHLILYFLVPSIYLQVCYCPFLCN